ncbi:MAG: nitroreductase family protein [Anaerolineae bacterium]|nr:nitroreductase family protein [Anaerolineae bacterium]
MEVLEAIYSRRSVRKFTAEPIPDALLSKMVEAALQAPSGGNAQPWAFLVIREPSCMRQLRALAPGIIGKPTAVVVICLDKKRATTLGGSLDEMMAGVDIGLAAQNLLLSAHALGLGGCAIASFHPSSVKSFLDLPEGIDPVLLVALGYPAQLPSSPGRMDLREVCFFERWGVTEGAR